MQQFVRLLSLVFFLSIPFAVHSQGLGDLSSLGGSLNQDPVEFSAVYQIDEGNLGTLKVTAVISEGWNMYSVTQPPGGPLKTKITVLTKEIEIAGLPIPDVDPKPYTDPNVFDGLIQEKHHGTVTWSVPIRFAKSPGTPLPQMEVRLTGQACEESCIPINKKFFATPLSNNQPSPTSPGSERSAADSKSKSSAIRSEVYRDPKSHVEWTVSVSQSMAKPHDRLELQIEATIDPEYHLYRMKVDDPETNFRTTLVMTKDPEFRFGIPIESSPFEKLKTESGTYDVHHGTINWKVPFIVGEKIAKTPLPFEGQLIYQACTKDLCDQPLAIRFSGMVGSESENAPPGTITIEAVSNKQVVNSPHRRNWFEDFNAPPVPIASGSQGVVTNGQPESQSETAIATAEVLTTKQIAWAFWLAILGGFVLNFMPCVLPVIGLKVLAFVEESEGSPKHIAWLNFWYILGIMAVVMSLAVATIVAKEFYAATFIWGSQFGNAGFRVAITVLVFAMALSFLGVWEIPIPGFASGKASSDLMQQEGISGAFFKGMITTVLATPCTGPFLGTALSLSLSQPAWIVLVIFFGVGVGISLPFIVIALFPKTMSWLPKPGPWMDTLKQALAFPLLLTVVFFLTNFSNDYRIAALTMLIGVWFACWLIGRVPPWAERSQRIKFWGIGIATAVVCGYLSFQYLGPNTTEIRWQPYDEVAFKKHVSEGKTVMIDFTAEWCPNCKTNLKFAIETKAVADLVARNGVVPMLADFTDQPEHIQNKLIELKQPAIPVLAIYPAGTADPIVHNGVVSQSMVLDALEKAGPSSTKGKTIPVSSKSNRDGDQ